MTSQNLPYFCQSSTRHDRGSSNFQIASTKLLYIWEHFTLLIKREVQIFKSLQQNCFIIRTFQFVIIGVGRIFKTPQQNCFLFQKISARDKRSSSNFQITSTRLLYYQKLLTRDNRGSWNFQNTSIKLLYFWENVSLVIKVEVQIFKSL